MNGRFNTWDLTQEESGKMKEWEIQKNIKS